MHPSGLPYARFWPLTTRPLSGWLKPWYPSRRTGSWSLGPGLTARLSGGAYVEPWHQFALSIISTALEDRPIYFASSGNAASELGLTPFIVRQGLAFKLNRGPTESWRGRGLG